MDTLTQGTFIKDNVLIEVIGTENSYRYKWIKEVNPAEQKTIDYDSFLPVFIIDYSWSMVNSQSARPATDAIKIVCKSLFEKSFTRVLLVFFGETAHAFCVTPTNVNNAIDDILKDYFTDASLHGRNGKFKACATIPTSGFIEAHEYIKKSSSQNVFISFLTDGEFSSGSINDWNNIFRKLKSCGKKMTISCIGYQNDYLKNIKLMKDCSDKAGIELIYTTIQNPSEIQKTLSETIEQFDVITTPKINLSDTVVLGQDDCIYSNQKLFYNLEPKDILTEGIKNTGVTVDWLMRCITFEIHIGIKENDILNKLGIKSVNLKGQYKNIVIELVPYFAFIQKKYLELKSEYKSLKSRNIPIWKALYERIESFSKLFRDMQIVISDELNEKKAFEITTKINQSISSRHMRSLQRRKIANDMNKKGDNYIITIECESPLVIKCHSTLSNDENESKKDMDSTLEQLKSYYTCTYSMDDWSDMLNTCIGCPIQYKWKEGDDWAASKSNIEEVSIASFISIDGYNEMQNIFGGIDKIPDHEKLYGSSKYIPSAHDRGNAFVPIATDPFFINKLQLIKERLGHMISGSSLGFRNGHILFYVAVIKQCFKQLLDNNTEKLRHCIMLLLNTFKILSNKISVIKDKSDTALTKSDILFNIACGNTAPYLFNGPYECVMFTLISSNITFQMALDKYNAEKNLNIDINSFKKLIWEMILRQLLIAAFKKQESWEDFNSWGLINKQEIEVKLKEEGQNAIIKYLLNENTVLAIPDNFKDKLNRIRDTKLIKVFKLFVSWADKLNDSIWDKFNRTFMPLPEVANTNILATHFSNNDIIDNYNYWTYWECYAYGQKECYPMRSHSEISKIVANNINRKYGEDITDILADINEFIAFKNRRYETRYLPVILAKQQSDAVNTLFIEVYNKKVDENQFKAIIKEILGNHYSEQIESVIKNDNLDVLKNLFAYCQKKQHQITIKIDSKLPYSCPGNTSSPYFLQEMTENEFLQYYKPTGCGWSTKKYSIWVNDLHPYMVSSLQESNDMKEFIDRVIAHAGTFRSIDNLEIDRYAKECIYFYNKFKV